MRGCSYRCSPCYPPTYYCPQPTPKPCNPGAIFTCPFCCCKKPPETKPEESCCEVKENICDNKCEAKESNPCLTICLKVQPDTDLRVKKTSENEICIYQCCEECESSEEDESSSSCCQMFCRGNPKVMRMKKVKKTSNRPNSVRIKYKCPDSETDGECKWCKMDKKPKCDDNCCKVFFEKKKKSCS